MRTRAVIGAIVAACIVAAIAIQAALMVWLGAWPGAVAGAFTLVFVLVLYRWAFQPWQHRWGATLTEAQRVMPGDALLPQASELTRTITRAISIAATPAQIWPWLVQLGFGRAGWYSYDWIDNDGQPSADRIIPELQDLAVGDLIPMLPEFGPRVIEIARDDYLVSDGDGSTWCLALYPMRDGTRLVSRWRAAWRLTPATAFWLLLSDPGSFIMEQKMLRGIRSRAEAAARAEPSERPLELTSA